MDDTDRALIAALREDSRRSVTELAGLLNLSRATVQSRIARALADGTIKRFTVELGVADPAHQVEAVTLIELQGAMNRVVIRALHKMPEVTSLHSTNGAWDLVARVQTNSLPGFDKVLRQIREIPGVVNSQTCLLLDEARP